MIEILFNSLFAALAGMGFGAISNPPRKAFLFIAILSSIGYITRSILMTYAHYDIAIASFGASLLIGFTSLPFGHLSKCPATVVYIPALLPMIPGKFAYNTIFSVVMFLKNMEDASLSQLYMEKFLSNGIITASVIFLLALGSTLPVFLFPNRAYQMTRNKKDSNK